MSVVERGGYSRGVLMTMHHSVNIDGLNIFYREAGRRGANTLLMLHGFPTSSHMFRDLIPLLADRYHVVAPDLPGFGFSDAPDSTQFRYTFENLAKIVDRFTETAGLTRYAIYVFDYGAPVGFRLALAHPERITAIISQNGNAYGEGLSQGWNPIQKYWKEPSDANRSVLRDFLKPESTKWQYLRGIADERLVAPEAYELDSALLARPGNDEIQLDLFLNYATNVALYPRFQEYFRTKRPPLLAVWGKNDPFFLPAGAEAFKRDNPKAEVHFFDTGHFALETHVHEIAATIREFLGRVAPLGPEGVQGSIATSLFDGLTEATVPAAAQPLLARTRELFGFAPNLAVAMSADPAALEGYLHALVAFAHTTLSPIEQQIVLMAVSRANEADYSVAVHATLAAKLGAASDIVRAVGTGRPVAEPKLAALQRFAEVLTVGRGQVSDNETERFLAAGYDRAAVVAVAFGVAIKAFANGVAHLAQPAVDSGFAPALAGLRG